MKLRFELWHLVAPEHSYQHPYRIIEAFSCSEGFRTRITSFSFKTEEEGLAKIVELMDHATICS